MIPYPGIDTDACKYAKCPVKKGDSGTFEADIEAFEWMPTVSYVEQIYAWLYWHLPFSMNA